MCVNSGGTSNLIRGILENFAKVGIEILPLDFTSLKIDFEVLLVFSFSYHNPDMLEKLKEKGVKIILWPIFDRTKSFWTFELYKFLEKTPVRTLFGIRQRILNSASLVLVGSESEKVDLQKCFGVRSIVVRLPMNSEFFDPKSELESKDLFFQKYQVTDFIIYSAAQISSRKNQITLLKALQNTDFKVVLTGCDQILVPEFQKLVAQNPNILCLGKIPLCELISAYQSARISVSLSNSETAGLSLLESAYFSCQLLVSSIPAFEEYLGDRELQNITTFLDNPKDLIEIKNKIAKIYNNSKSRSLPNSNQKITQNHIKTNFSYPNYIAKIQELINTKIK